MKKSKGCVSRASSTSASSDDIPIAVMQKSKNGLFTHERKVCEFCETVLYNQYDFHVHNTEHIIIPLLKQTVYQCTICLFHFTSIEELQFHSAVKHDISTAQLQRILDKSNMTNEKITTAIKDKVSKNGKGNGNITKDKIPDILESIITKEPKVVCDNSLNTFLSKKNERNIQCLFNKQPIVLCENIAELFENSVSIKKENGSIKNENGNIKKENGNIKKENGNIKKENGSIKTDTDSNKLDKGTKSLENCIEVKKNKTKDILIEKYKDTSTHNKVEACSSNVKNIESNLIKKGNKTSNEKKNDNDPPSSSIKSKIVFEDDSDLEIYEDDLDPEEIPLLNNRNLIPSSFQKEIVPSKTFTPTIKETLNTNSPTYTQIIKETPHMSNQNCSPIIQQIPLINPTFTRINNLKQIPLINPAFAPVNSIREIPMINPVLTPINNQTFIPPINEFPDTTAQNHISETVNSPDVEVLDLCSDEPGDNDGDYILPDEGDLDTQLIVPEPNYILPDCEPLLPVPPVESQTKPRFGKIMLGSKISQNSTNNFARETFVPSNTFGNYMQNFNANSDMNPASTSTPIHPNQSMFLNNKFDNANSTSQPTFVASMNSHKILLGSKPPQETVNYAPSVHYDDLMSPGLYPCKRCKQKFPTRLHLITHETSHIKLSTQIQPTSCRNCATCDRYITGGHYGLGRHKRENHEPYTIKKHYNKYTCERCHLKYRRLSKHEYNYHRIYVCHKCGHRFEKEHQRESHLKRNCFEAYKNTIEDDVKVLKMCEMCVLFLKDRPSLKYVVTGEFSESGKRQTCVQCNKDFFEVKLVNRIQKRKKYEYTDKPVKMSSNKQRLKNIQCRLKKFNKLPR